MKKIVIVLVLLLFCGAGSQTMAADVEFSMDVGALIRTGTPSMFAYGANITPKFYSLDTLGRHYFSGLVSVLRSDFEGGDTYFGRGYPLYYQRPLITIFKLPFNVGAGIGKYWNIKTDGDDDTDLAHIVTLSVETWKLAIMLKGEAFEKEGPDGYFAGGSILFLF
jgi:hypothetical protein